MPIIERNRNIQSVVTRVVLMQPQFFSFKDVTKEVSGKIGGNESMERIEFVCKNTLRVLKNSNKVKVLPDERYELIMRLPYLR